MSSSMLWRISVFTLAFFFLFTGCSGNSSSEGESEKSSEVTLKLGYRPKALADVTPVILSERGFSVEGLDVEMKEVSSPPQAFASYKAGEIDAIAGMPLAAVFAQVDTTLQRPFRAYYHQVDKAGSGWVSLVSNKDMSISSVQDLAGRTVMSLPTKQAKYLLRRILRSAGLSSEEIEISQYNPVNPTVPLRSGQGAAIFGLEPAISKAVSEGHKVLVRGPVSRYLYDGQPVPVSASLISESFVEEHPEAYDKFVSLIDRASDYASSQPDSVRQYFRRPEYGGLDAATADLLFMPVMTRPDSSLRRTTSRFIEDLRSAGFLKGETKTYISPLFPEQDEVVSAQAVRQSE